MSASTLSQIRAAAGRTGGLRRSAAQLAALDAMHRNRRGKRVQPRPPPGLIEQVRTILRDRPERGRISIRALADALGVADSTVRRWLSGVDWPAPDAVRGLRRWVRRTETG